MVDRQARRKIALVLSSRLHGCRPRRPSLTEGRTRSMFATEHVQSSLGTRMRAALVLGRVPHLVKLALAHFTREVVEWAGGSSRERAPPRPSHRAPLKPESPPVSYQVRGQDRSQSLDTCVAGKVTGECACIGVGMCMHVCLCMRIHSYVPVCVCLCMLRCMLMCTQVCSRVCSRVHKVPLKHIYCPLFPNT